MQRRTGRIALIALACAAGAVVIVLAAKVGAHLYYDPALWAVAGWVVPPDLGIFLNAGDAVLDGRTPYQDVDGIGHYLGYVYPPLLAFVDHSALGPALSGRRRASGR